jgi:multiple sugar transport system substrate-binding protein
MRRQTTTRLAAAAATVVALGISGCSAGGESGSDSGTISLWVRDSQSRFMNSLAEAFNASHETKVEVTLVTAADYVQKFGTAAAGGDAPDVASIDLVYVPYFASVGALTDISDRVAALPWANDMSPAHTAQGKYEGATYSVPFTADVSVMFYNKDLFSRAGLDPDDPPSTTAEFKDAAEKVAAIGDGSYGTAISGACGGCNIFQLTPHIWASGGNVLSDDGAKALLDTPEVGDTLRLYRDLWDARTMPELVQSDNGPNAGQAFQDGRVGIKNDGTFFVGSLADVGFQWGVAPIPGEVDGQHASFAGGDNLTIPSGAKNPDGAWEFLEWATGQDAQTILAEAGVMPTRMDLLGSIYTPLDPRYKVFADALAVGHCPYSVVENQLFNDSNGIWATMIQESVFGGADIAQAQAKAQEAAQALLDGANR